jgi:hypothetical protein
LEQQIYNDTLLIGRDTRHRYYTTVLDHEQWDEKALAEKGKLHNVTKATGMLSKPQLIPWASKIGVQVGMSAVKAGLLASGSKVSKEDVYKLANQERAKRVKVSTDRGQKIHAFLEGVVNSRIAGQDFFDPVDAEVKAAYVEFQEWEAKHTIRWLAAERILFHPTHMYVGTADGLAEIDGVPTVLDFKTGAAVYPDQGLQLAAYAAAWHTEVNWTRWSDKGNRWPLMIDVDEVESVLSRARTQQAEVSWECRRMILHFDKTKKEKLTEFNEQAILKKTGSEDWDTDYRAFLGCLTLLKWKMGGASSWELKQ